MLKYGLLPTESGIRTEGSAPFIGTMDSNNEIANYIANYIGQGAIYDSNTISLSYNSSVGEAFYQYQFFCAIYDLNLLYF